MIENANSSPEVIGGMYDNVTEFFLEALGGSIHYGYWHDGDDASSISQASHQMTSLMINKAGVTADHHVLDIGCGAGMPAVDLAEETGARVTGITISAQQVRLANQLAESRGLAGRAAFQRADAADLPFAAGTFDSAWLFESLLHMPDPGRVLREAARVMRHDARLAIANVVVRRPLGPDEEKLLNAFSGLVQAPSILPLDCYPALLQESGLELLEISDVSDNSVRRTFEHVNAAAVRLLGTLEDGPSSAANKLLKGTREITAKLAQNTGIGYAIVVARKATHRLMPPPA
ncbi:SAM-dependent methyltransferase [Streptomyces xanthochromogenes]|uniref:SAM-dependent methyltransferase n=1 Tax=Streptomyces xanthochromogenes TaxID=67384 RepID=UPI0038183ECC